MYEAESPRGRPVAQVLLDSALPQLDHLFDYAVPESLAADMRVGQRVRVPFRSQNRRSHGYVISFSEHSDFSGELQPIAEIVGFVPVLTPQIWRLARAVTDRAAGSASDILRLAIPKRMVRAEKQHINGTAVDPSDENSPFEPDDQTLEFSQLLSEGARLAVTVSHGPERLTTGEWVGGWAVRLARAALAVHALGRSAILVAPDYRDVDQLYDALVSLGHPGVVRVDSRQSGSARYAAFLRVLDHKPRIVLGNRSAIYAPAHKLGAIIMWDDSDPLLSEPLAPYVHVRDAALVRATIETDSGADSPVGLLFAAHTTSIEVQRLIEIGYVTPQLHPERRTRVIAAEAALHSDFVPSRIPDIASRAIREGLEHGPVLVQVAAPGYAPTAVCKNCGERARCLACAGPIAFRKAQRAACRWCGEHAASWRCPECSSTYLVQRGAGSERTAEQFKLQFPDTRIILSDGAHPHERVDSRSALVVATRGAEPIAAGGYKAVILLDAESLLAIETLRAAEDCLRWWQNAAALAAPGAKCVLASGGGPVVQAFVTGRIDEWLRSELRDRQALRFPPAVRVASVTGGRDEVHRALGTLDDLAGVDVLGPAPVQAEPTSAGTEPHGSFTTEPLVRAIVRFDYSQGSEVAKRLRAALVADAAGSSSRVAGRQPRRARPQALRLRFDDRAVLDS